LKKDVAKLLLDVGKLVLGSIVFGSVLRREIPEDILLTGATAAVIVIFVAGIIMGIEEMKTEKTPVLKRKRRKKC